MTKHRLIPVDSAADWNDALEGIRHSFYHTCENCRAMSLTTGFKTYLYVYLHGDSKIICPISEREYKGYTDIVTPYGFSGFAGQANTENFLSEWNEFAGSRKYVCGYISLNPAFAPEELCKASDGVHNTNLYFINTSLSLTELFGNLDSNRKKQIKDFRSAESKFIYDRGLLTEFFIKEYYNFLKRINASEANYFTEETLKYISGLENVFLVGAGNSEKIEALFVFAYTKYSGDCLFNISTETGKQFAPLLLWRGLKFFKSKKIPLMNLGGGSRPDDNVALSKERYGAYKLPFVNLKQIYDKEIYEMLCAQAGTDSSDIQGYFPAYRRKLN